MFSHKTSNIRIVCVYDRTINGYVCLTFQKGVGNIH